MLKLSDFKDEPIAEEEIPLEELTEEIPDQKEYHYSSEKCQPRGTLKERLIAEKALFGIYPFLCQKCRDRIRDAIVSLQMANAEETIDNLDIKKFIKE